jgi:Phage integrase family.
MLTSKNKDGTRRLNFTRDEYENIILEYVDDKQTEVIVRFLGGVGLRVGVLNGITYADIKRTENDEFLLDLDNAKDTTGEYDGGKGRTVFVPDEVERVAYEYMHEKGLHRDDPLINISKRAIQYRLEKLRESLVKETDDERWGYLSAHDFRASLTNYLLHHSEVKPSVVKHQMGWESWETMKEYEEQPDENILVDEFKNI